MSKWIEGIFDKSYDLSFVLDCEQNKKERDRLFVERCSRSNNRDEIAYSSNEG